MRLYQTKSNFTGNDTPASTYLNAAEFNSFALELYNAVNAGNTTPDDPIDISDNAGANPAEIFTQLAQSMSIHGMGGAQHMVDSSGGGAFIVLNPIGNRVVPPKYFDGMKISFEAAHTNLAGVNLTVGGLTGKLVKDKFGVTDIKAGAMQIGQYVNLRYEGDHATGNFRLDNEGKGSFGQNGYQMFESGLIIQWGEANVQASPHTVTFLASGTNIDYPNFCQVAFAIDSGLSGGPNVGHLNVDNLAKTGFDIGYSGTVKPALCYWMTIGW